MYNLQDAAMIQLGQLGSGLLDLNATTFTPPSGKVVVAITMLTDCAFDATTGLIADGGTGTYINTAGAGASGVAVDSSNVFPKGVTIYGRWTSLSVNTDAETCICYLGD